MNKTYSVNDATKNKIIEVSTKLFYEQGYKETYLDQIAFFCGITEPLISYYFKIKPTLAKIVSCKFQFESGSSTVA